MQAIVLFAHGSRDPLWHRPIQAVAAQIKHRAGHDADLAALVEHVQSLVKNANQNK